MYKFPSLLAGVKGRPLLWRRSEGQPPRCRGSAAPPSCWREKAGQPPSRRSARGRSPSRLEPSEQSSSMALRTGRRRGLESTPRCMFLLLVSLSRSFDTFQPLSCLLCSHADTGVLSLAPLKRVVLSVHGAPSEPRSLTTFVEPLAVQGHEGLVVATEVAGSSVPPPPVAAADTGEERVVTETAAPRWGRIHRPGPARAMMTW
jgi:hypothetical protein